MSSCLLRNKRASGKQKIVKLGYQAFHLVHVSIPAWNKLCFQNYTLGVWCMASDSGTACENSNWENNLAQLYFLLCTSIALWGWVADRLCLHWLLFSPQAFREQFCASKARVVAVSMVTSPVLHPPATPLHRPQWAKHAIMPWWKYQWNQRWYVVFVAASIVSYGLEMGIGETSFL